MNKYAMATFIVCWAEGFICYLIGYMVGITHDKRTITHECVKDTHDKGEPNSSEKPNDCDTCRFELYWPEMCEGCCEWDSHYEPKDEPQTGRSSE